MTSYAVKSHLAKREHRATRALQKLIENSPGFGSLSLWVKHEDVEKDRNGALAWTNYVGVSYPPAFEKLNLKQKTAVSAHELMHVVFRHRARALALRKHIGEIDGYLWNIAGDAIINQGLLKFSSYMELPGTPPILVELLKEVLGEDWEPEKALAHWTIESLYKAIADKCPKIIVVTSGYGKGQKQTEDGRSNAERARAYGEAKGFEEDMEPLRPDETSNPAKEAEETRIWRSRLVRAMAGDGARGILRQIIGDLPRTETPWEHVLRSRLTRALTPESEETWTRPSRRYLALAETMLARGHEMPYEPGINPDRPALDLVVMVDTSGSTEDLMNTFAAEICGIKTRTGATVTVIVCDAKVHGMWKLDPEPGRRDLVGRNGKPIEFKGGGGTDFGPAVAEANKLRPAIGVFLTDLQGPCNVKPNFPIIWAVPKRLGDAPKPPFGQLLLIE